MMAERAVIGRNDVLDLIRQQEGRVHLARGGRPKEQDDLAARPDRLVGQHANSGHAQATGYQEKVAAPAVNLERTAKRPQHVDRLTLPDSFQPLGAASDGSEVNGKDAGRGIHGVERKRPAQHQARVIARPYMDELSGTRPRHQ